MLTLNDLIKLSAKGAKRIPIRGRETYFDYLAVGGFCACYFGCVYAGAHPRKNHEALYDDANGHKVSNWLDTELGDLLNIPIPHPFPAPNRDNDLESIIIFLNDEQRWSVDAINEWLKGIQNEL